LDGIDGFRDAMLGAPLGKGGRFSTGVTLPLPTNEGLLPGCEDDRFLVDPVLNGGPLGRGVPVRLKKGMEPAVEVDSVGDEERGVDGADD
jgi:hypothetical protein